VTADGSSFSILTATVLDANDNPVFGQSVSLSTSRMGDALSATSG